MRSQSLNIVALLSYSTISGSVPMRHHRAVQETFHFSFCLLILSLIMLHDVVAQGGLEALVTTNAERPAKTLYLNLIWHQHQPLYLDPSKDELQGPWVRTHGTKDYYDMVSILEAYPDIHFTVNLTASLLVQIEEFYVQRLGGFVDVKRNRVDAKQFLSRYRGKLDPWIDLALTPTSRFKARELGFLVSNTWNCFSISEVMIDRFPEYKAMRTKFRREGAKGLSEQDRRDVKFWFYLANFDPDFLERKVRLVTGTTVDLTDLVQKLNDGSYRLKKTITEDDCNRIVAETYKVMASIVPVHRKMMYDPAKKKGQIEVTTTPFYHPILPLIYDSDLARLSQPDDPMPARFDFPQDASEQVGMSVAYFRKLFRAAPRGMWPAEGSVSHDVAAVFSKHGIRWIATDERILAKSKAKRHEKYYPYALGGNALKKPVALVFRDTELSDKIGFTYKEMKGSEAAEDFIQSILKFAPDEGESDRLLTVILDGENAWEWYRFDNDGKEFRNELYRRLTELHRSGRVITTTMSEYTEGNPSRKVPPHPVDKMEPLEWLWPGSWINGNYDTWIGEPEENQAWEYLRIARQDLENSGLKRPDMSAPVSRKGTPAWYARKAWESMYAAEGSDWFWWYGSDQSSGGTDRPFDVAFITYLENVYKFARGAKVRMPRRTFEPIIHAQSESSQASGGAMAQSMDARDVLVRFEVDLGGRDVPEAVFVAGSVPALGNWVPNKIRMFDNGRNGDSVSGDAIWTLEVRLPAGSDVDYKYTNSGSEGSWSPGEEFSVKNRKLRVHVDVQKTQEVRDRFGEM
ncbi:MAG TPA: hypothetical protein DEP53_14325 [Bacteroidetes bacterium]|nr:hypothetical protein [Bacteroidota bacterium]